MSRAKKIIGVDCFPLDPNALRFPIETSVSGAGQMIPSLAANVICSDPRYRHQARDVYFLTPDEMALIARRYPGWDWESPQWQLVVRDLMRAGYDVGSVNKCNVMVLLDWLKKVDAAQVGATPAPPPTGGKGPATDAGNVGTTPQNAQSDGNVHGAVGPRLNQLRVTKNEANVKAREYLRKHPKAKARELANGIGCSVGLVPELTAWKAVQEERKKRQQKAPKAVALTDKVTATHAAATKTPADIVAEEEVLRRLLAQFKDPMEQDRIAKMSPEKREELFEALKDQLGDAQADGLTAAPDAGDDKTKPRFCPRRKV